MYGSGIFWCLAVWSTDLSCRFVLWHQWNCSQGWIIECSNPSVLVIFGGWFVMFVHWRLSSQLMPVNWCQCVTVEVICRPVTEKSKWYGFEFSSENEAAAASENMSKEKSTWRFEKNRFRGARKACVWCKGPGQDSFTSSTVRIYWREVVMQVSYFAYVVGAWTFGIPNSICALGQQQANLCTQCKRYQCCRQKKWLIKFTTGTQGYIGHLKERRLMD